MSTDFDTEAETNFKGPGPILRPQRPPPPPPTETETSLFSDEIQNPNLDSVEPENRPTLLFEFTDLFDKFDYGAVRQRILHRNLNRCSFSTILWRIFLHCLPTGSTTWPRALESSRKDYDDFAKFYVRERHEISKQTKIEQVDDHPLSLEENSLWSQFHQNKELRENLEQDVRRTCPELSFFRDANIQELLTKVLFLHSLKHEKTFPYRQGMHEILGVIVYSIHSEATRVNEYPESNELMKIIYNLNYLEHDAFSIYEKIMEHLRQFYDIKSENPSERKPVRYSVQTNDMANRVNKILKRLRLFDAVLDAKLKEFDLDPLIYGIRWLRLLFGREIEFESIPNLWTLIFCYDENFGFIDHFFLALLIERGKSLENQRNSMCFSSSLQFLLPNEVISDSERIIAEALSIAEQSSSKPSSPRQPIGNESNPFESDRENFVRAKDSSRLGLIGNVNRPISLNQSFLSTSNKSKSASSFVTKEAELEPCPAEFIRSLVEENAQIQKKTADYAEKFIGKLENGLKTNSIPDEDKLQNCVNGIKYIVDVLTGVAPLIEKTLEDFWGSTHEDETN